MVDEGAWVPRFNLYIVGSQTRPSRAAGDPQTTIMNSIRVVKEGVQLISSPEHVTSRVVKQGMQLICSPQHVLSGRACS